MPAVSYRDELDAALRVHKSVFLRNINNATEWTLSDEATAATVLLDDSGISSFFMASSSDEVAAVAVNRINLRRNTNKQNYIWFTREELEACGSRPEWTTDEEKNACIVAQRAHRNCRLSIEQCLELVKMARQTASKRDIQIPPRDLKSIGQRFAEQGCHAAKPGGACVVPVCAPAAVTT